MEHKERVMAIFDFKCELCGKTEHEATVGSDGIGIISCVPKCTPRKTQPTEKEMRDAFGELDYIQNSWQEKDGQDVKDEACNKIRKVLENALEGK
jgi:hypothetical protein